MSDAATRAGNWCRWSRCDGRTLLMLLFFALSAVPLEVLFDMPAPGSVDVIRERASAAGFVLDLVDATA